MAPAAVSLYDARLFKLPHHLKAIRVTVSGESSLRGTQDVLLSWLSARPGSPTGLLGRAASVLEASGKPIGVLCERFAGQPAPAWSRARTAWKLVRIPAFGTALMATVACCQSRPLER
jgi:hypothetical protein